MKKKCVKRGLLISMLVAAMMFCIPAQIGKAFAAPDPQPVKIGTYDALQTFISGINDGSIDPSQDAELTADITVPESVGSGWIPLARDLAHEYQGTFDGAGHTVSGINVSRTYPDPWTKGTPVESYTAFLSFLGADGVVTGLKVDANIKDVNDVAGIVSQNSGTISNCSFKGTLSSEVYENSGSGESVLYPDGELDSASGESGCIAAVNLGTVTNCRTASESMISHGGVDCGGIIGVQYDGGKVTDCENNAAVTLHETTYKVDASFEGAAGGIVGSQGVFSGATEKIKPSIENCINHGTITCENLAGGICGESAFGDLIGCTNDGTVKGVKRLWGGGIVGYMTSLRGFTGDDASTLKNCINKGEINLSETPEGNYIGGIAGEIEDAISMRGYVAPVRVCDCINFGPVGGSFGVGGVIGYLSNSAYSDGNIDLAYVYELVNLGDVRGHSDVGGVTGSNPGVMASAINYGSVHGLPGYAEKNCIVGGIAGDCGSTGNISCGYNLGSIDAKDVTKYDVYLGGVTGAGTGDFPGCYYCMDTSGDARCAVASRAESIEGTLSLEDMAGVSAKTGMPEFFDGKTGFHPQTVWTTLDPVTRSGKVYPMTPQMTALPVSLDDILAAGTDTSGRLKKSIASADVTVDGSSVYAGGPVIPGSGVNVVLNGKALVQGTDYETYNCYNNVCAGIGTILVTGRGDYSDAAQGTFTILPAKAGIRSVTVGKKKMTVKMKGKPYVCGAESYQIQYRIKGKASWKTVTCRSSSKTIKGLKKGKKYQVRVRAYSDDGSSTYAGEWSKIKTTKKIK